MYDLAVKNNKFLHIPPRELKKKHIDPKLRDICERINKTDYCWTVFSCQGHFSGSQKTSLPYLVLLCANEKRPHILNQLYSAFEHDAEYDLNFPLLGPRSHMILVSLGLKDENFTYISIHFHVKGKKDQDYCLKVMDNFSRTI
jgi:hypothetical protein